MISKRKKSRRQVKRRASPTPASIEHADDLAQTIGEEVIADLRRAACNPRVLPTLLGKVRRGKRLNDACLEHSAKVLKMSKPSSRSALLPSSVLGRLRKMRHEELMARGELFESVISAINLLRAKHPSVAAAFDTKPR